MIQTWIAYNHKNGEFSEAIEPISFKQFLVESGLGNEKCVNVSIAKDRKTLEQNI